MIQVNSPEYKHYIIHGVFIRHNQRDKTVFDLFKLNLQTHKLTKVAQNPGKVYRWLIDDNGKLRGRFRKMSDDVSRFDYLSETTEPNKRNNKWTKVREWNFDECFNIVGFTNKPPQLWVTSNIGRDKTALFKMDVPSGALHYVYSEKEVDLGSVYISQVDHQPIFVSSMPGYPRAHFFDRKTKVEFKHLKERFKGYLHIISADNSERNIVISSSTEKQVRHYLHNRDNGKSVLLGVHALSKYESILSSRYVTIDRS